MIDFPHATMPYKLDQWMGKESEKNKVDPKLQVIVIQCNVHSHLRET